MTKLHVFKDTIVPKKIERESFSTHGAMQKDLRSIKTGLRIRKASLIYRNYVNCFVCPWRNTPLCPHLKEIGDKKGKKLAHTNGYCTTWLDFVKTNFELAGTKPKLFQMAEIVKGKVQSDKMYMEWAKTGKLHRDFTTIQKNLIAGLDKMRRQDEGVKINQDVNIVIDDFRKVVDAQAEVVKGKDIIAEYEEMEEEDKNGRNRENLD